jgi:hypothetical protein
MKLPIDTSGLTFLLVGSPAPVTEYGTEKPVIDRESGQQLHTVRLVALAQDEAEIIAVKVPRAASAGKEWLEQLHFRRACRHRDRSREAIREMRDERDAHLERPGSVSRWRPPGPAPPL